MNRLLHAIGSVLGPAAAIIPIATDAIPNPTAKVVLVITGSLISLLSNVFRAVGKQPAP